jgi:ribose transport system permease protein
VSTSSSLTRDRGGSSHMKGPATPDASPGRRGRALRKARAMLPAILLITVVIVVTAIMTPEFFNSRNILNVLRQASITGVVAIGMTFVILTAGIDLSVGSVLAFTGVVFAIWLQGDMPILLAAVLTLVVGCAVGAINGFGAAYLRIQPFIMTLAMLAIAAGLALAVTNGTEQNFERDGWLLDVLGNGNVAGIPGPFVVFVLVAAIGWAVLRYLPFGRYVYAVGGSDEAAFLSGVKVRRVIFAVYVIAGLTAALGGLMTSSRLYAGEPTAGGLVNLDAIAMVVIGGTSLFGGRGGVGGTVIGVLLLTIVTNVLNLEGVSIYNQEIARGVIIVIAVLITSREFRAILRQRIRAVRSPPTIA